MSGLYLLTCLLPPSSALYLFTTIIDWFLAYRYPPALITCARCVDTRETVASSPASQTQQQQHATPSAIIHSTSSVVNYPILGLAICPSSAAHRHTATTLTIIHRQNHNTTKYDHPHLAPHQTTRSSLAQHLTTAPHITAGDLAMATSPISSTS